MNLITEGEHTVVEPKPGNKVLDVGCRFFTFANAMQKRGCEVYAVEPDTEVKSPSDKIHLMHTALVSRQNTGTNQELIKWSYGEGNHLASIGGERPIGYTIQVTPCLSIETICADFKVPYWDIIKLDCEGAEYEVLLDWPGPIAGQITVEFHDHTGANPGGEVTYKKIIEHLSQWYDVVQHKREPRCVGRVMNYWDSLFILRKTKNRGLLTVAFGEEYDKLAAHTVAYSRKFTDLPFCVLTNLKDRHPLWDGIPNVEFIEFDAEQDRNREFKLQMIDHTPFDETLYIDCDAVVQKEGVDRVFSFLGTKNDLVLDLYLYWYEGDKILRIAKRAMLEAGVGLPLSICCGGFICFKKNKRVKEFFDCWLDIWKRTGRGREMFEMNCAVKLTSVEVHQVTQERHCLFAPMTRQPKCIIQHNYNSQGEFDFHNEFNFPRILQNKPFDSDPKDWNWVDF